MQFSLLRGNGVSLGEQARQEILRRINDGIYGPGSRLPPETELADDFGASLAPIRTALAALAASGHVNRVQGRGTFVADPALSIEVALFPSLTDVLRRQGVAFTMRQVRTAIVSTPDEIAPWFTEVPEQVFSLHRTLLVQGQPVAALDAWMPSPDFDELANQDFTQGASLYDAVWELYGMRPTNKDGVLSVIDAASEAAEDLHVSLGRSVVRVIRSASDGTALNTTVEVSRTYYKPTVFNFRLSEPRQISE